MRRIALGRTTLGDDILVAYKRAMREQKWAVAELLLCALEGLADTDSSHQLTLDQAYLLIAPSKAPKA